MMMATIGPVRRIVAVVLRVPVLARRREPSARLTVAPPTRASSA
jgi:hypothetical protein